MGIQYSTTIRTNRMDQVNSGIGANAYLRIYDGTKPTNPGTALSSNTLLAELRGDASAWAAAASAGVLTANAITQDSGADAGSVATFFRIYKSDGTTCAVQGTVTATGGGGDLTLTTTTIVSGQPVSVSGFVLTEGNA